MLGNLIAPLLAPPPALQNAITEAEKWNIEGNKLFYAATTAKDGNFYLDTEHHCPDALPLLEKSVPYYQRAVIIEPNTEIYRSNLQNTKTAVYACQHGFQFAAHFHHLDILKPRLADRLPMPDLHRRAPVSDPKTLKQIEQNRVRQAQASKTPPRDRGKVCQKWDDPAVAVVCDKPTPECCPYPQPRCVENSPGDCSK